MFKQSKISYTIFDFLSHAKWIVDIVKNYAAELYLTLQDIERLNNQRGRHRLYVNIHTLPKSN